MNPDYSPFDLVRRCRDGSASPSAEEIAQLESSLRDDADFRLAYVRYINLDVGLSAAAKTLLITKTTRTESRPHGSVWLSWRPLTAAAAGIVLGLLCTSVVFAYVAPSFGKVVSLIQESFESGPAPLVTGVPQELNRWGGDYSEVIGAQQGVTPKEGRKMARLLRSDFEGKTFSKPSRQGDLMRVIDVRPFLREAAGGEVVITLSALFNAAPFPDAELSDGVVTLWALGPRFPTEENLMDDALAHSVGMCRPLDRDPATWQNASTRLLLPPGTQMVLLKVSFSPIPQSRDSLAPTPDHVTFAGHFVDDVRASVSIRKNGATRGTQITP